MIVLKSCLSAGTPVRERGKRNKTDERVAPFRVARSPSWPRQSAVTLVDSSSSTAPTVLLLRPAEDRGVPDAAAEDESRAWRVYVQFRAICRPPVSVSQVILSSYFLRRDWSRGRFRARGF